MSAIIRSMGASTPPSIGLGVQSQPGNGLALAFILPNTHDEEERSILRVLTVVYSSSSTGMEIPYLDTTYIRVL